MGCGIEPGTLESLKDAVNTISAQQSLASQDQDQFGPADWVFDAPNPDRVDPFSFPAGAPVSDQAGTTITTVAQVAGCGVRERRRATRVLEDQGNDKIAGCRGRHRWRRSRGDQAARSGTTNGQLDLDRHHVRQHQRHPKLGLLKRPHARPQFRGNSAILLLACDWHGRSGQCCPRHRSFRNEFPV